MKDNVRSIRNELAHSFDVALPSALSDRKKLQFSKYPDIRP